MHTYTENIFLHYLLKGPNFEEKNVIEHKCVLISSTTFSETF